MENDLANYSLLLTQNTLTELTKWQGKRIGNKIFTKNDVGNRTQELLDDVLCFFQYLLTTGLISEANFHRTFERILNQVKAIDFLPENKRGLYGEFVAGEKKIYINPNLPREKRKLYLFHELSHACFKDNQYAPFVGERMRHSTIYGYMVIEEAIAQNIAETCYYASIGQARPQKNTQTERFLPNIQYQTNFDFYGLYQPLAVAFGRTLNDVGESEDDDEDKILFDLCKKALKEDLLDSIVEEYVQEGIGEDLVLTFYALANIYSAKLLSFGGKAVIENEFDRNAKVLAQKELRPTPKETSEFYSNVLKIMKKNENYRQQPESC